MVDQPTSYDLLGFRITAATKAQLMDFIAKSIEDDTKKFIVSQNVHGIYMFLTDENFRSLHRDGRTCVHIDGTPIIWLGRLLGLPLDYRHRTGVRDWIMLLFETAAKRDWRVYYLGGEPEILERGLKTIRRKVPAVRIAGHHGFFDADVKSSENLAILDQINDFQPHVLLVGMGMGRQERWITDNVDGLNVNCICTTGACMELIAEKRRIPPRWMGRAGVEWVFRLGQSPRRLAWRYLVEPWLAAWLLLRYNLRLRSGTGRWR